MSFYDNMKTLVGKQIDERLPGTNNFHFKNVELDWLGIYEWMVVHPGNNMSRL